MIIGKQGAILRNDRFKLGSVVPVADERVKTTVFTRHITRSSATGTTLP